MWNHLCGNVLHTSEDYTEFGIYVNTSPTLVFQIIYHIFDNHNSKSPSSESLY